jgi:hypothetical protein
MKLQINTETKISSLQKDFNTYFPFLKIEFFKHRHDVHEGNPKKDILSTDLVLSKVSKKNHPTEIVLKSNMTVAELEKLFMDSFGLSAQVFRKSGNSWLETSVTDDWTLTHQNNEGKELSNLAD